MEIAETTVLTEVLKNDLRVTDLIRVLLSEHGENNELRNTCLKILWETSRRNFQQIEVLRLQLVETQQQLKRANEEKFNNPSSNLKSTKPKDIGTALISRKISTLTSMIIIGMGIGWIAGLSVSPAIPVVLIGLTGAFALIVAAISSLNNDGEFIEPTSLRMNRLHNISPFPFTMLIIGMVLGTGMGILARTHNWFSPN